MDRHGLGPTSLSALRTLLSETRQRGYAVESGEVTPGFASVAAAVLDHNDHPVAGIAVTYPADERAGPRRNAPVDREAVIAATLSTAAVVTARLGGRLRAEVTDR